MISSLMVCEHLELLKKYLVRNQPAETPTRSRMGEADRAAMLLIIATIRACIGHRSLGELAHVVRPYESGCLRIMYEQPDDSGDPPSGD